LAASQLRLPSEARMAALAARLSGTGVVLAEPVRSPVARELPRLAPASERPLELSAKAVVAGVGLGVVALVGALAWRYALPHPSAQPAPAPRTSVSVAAGAPAPVSSVRALPPAAPIGVEHAPVALGVEQPSSAAPALEADESDSAPRAALGSTEVPAPAVAALAVARPAAPNASAHSTLHELEPEPKRAALSAPLRAGGAAGNSEAPSLPANTVIDSEVEMLKKARSALASDSLQAFALSERCRAQYPNGAFTQEREFIAISALLRLGRRDEARGRASLFRTHYRNSAYLPQLARMLGEE
jgi:hypothetical protein